MQAEAEDLEEAGNELMLLDDEVAPYVVGECFVHLPKEEVEGKLEEGECSPYAGALGWTVVRALVSVGYMGGGVRPAPASWAAAAV